MTTKRNRLGRNLQALLGPNARLPADQSAAAEQHIQDIELAQLHSGHYQPRQNFDETTLQELADSIRAQGIIQPIVVRKSSKQGYEILAGERRSRAAKLAGLTYIPAIVHDVTNREALALSLIENIQRDDLNPLEEAVALKRLQDEFNLTHQQIAETVGKSRTTITNLLRLLTLTQPTQNLLQQGLLEMGHARALLPLSGAQQASAAEEVIAKQLTVRQTEALIRRLQQPESGSEERLPPQRSVPLPAHLEKWQQEISDQLAQPVQIKTKANGGGHLSIAFADVMELEQLLQQLLSESAIAAES